MPIYFCKAVGCLDGKSLMASALQAQAVHTTCKAFGERPVITLIACSTVLLPRGAVEVVSCSGSKDRSVDLQSTGSQYWLMRLVLADRLEALLVDIRISQCWAPSSSLWDSAVQFLHYSM